ncbi:hypothetical protein NQ318_006782 [Aromia moschata]|uniref:Uncharacterized protein n=1 Tax=Aromia moschata TaxID=1265417 RepID=A0AAV8Y5W8_9CUCU|nr:hypothetical protein NQ318_006782 [Aromia moschata]
MVLSNTLFWVCCVTLLVTAECREPSKLLWVDRLRWDFLNLEETLWDSVLDYVENNVKHEEALELNLIRNYEEFGDKINEPVGPTTRLCRPEGIYALYETFRRFQKQQTAPERIPSPKRAWTDLAETILYDSKSNVESSMNRVHDMVSGICSKNAKSDIYFQEVEGDMLCNSQQSPQQVLLNLYNAIALTELKGYTMIQFSYMLLRLYEQGNFTKEAQLIRDRYQDRTNSAVKAVKKVIENTSRDLWNCDPKKHIKDYTFSEGAEVQGLLRTKATAQLSCVTLAMTGIERGLDGLTVCLQNHQSSETYEEITQLLQGYVQNEVDLNPEGTCRENCAEYSYTKSHGCYKNLYCQQQRRCNGKIISCRFFDSDMWICPARPESGRRYEYIEYENGRVLGRKQGCTRGTTKVDSWWRWLFWHCSYCFCLCDEQGTNSDRYFNMRPTIANITNNRVVTGLRFVKKNRIIHLQIQEGELMPRGKINTETLHWVPVEDYKITDRKIFNGQDYHTLSSEKRAIDLDDLEANEGYILTGVRFKEIGSHLNFEIFTTKFDFDTGKLLNPTSTSVWKDNPNTDSSMKKPKDQGEIEPPRHTDSVHIALDSNLKIRSIRRVYAFGHRQRCRSDDGAVPGRTEGGIVTGCAVKRGRYLPQGESNFGGFVAPKIITYDFSKHIKAAFPGEEVN